MTFPYPSLYSDFALLFGNILNIFPAYESMLFYFHPLNNIPLPRLLFVYIHSFVLSSPLVGGNIGEGYANETSCQKFTLPTDLRPEYHPSSYIIQKDESDEKAKTVQWLAGEDAKTEKRNICNNNHQSLTPYRLQSSCVTMCWFTFDFVGNFSLLTALR